MVYVKDILNSILAFSRDHLLPAALIFAGGFFIVKIILKLIGKMFKKSKLDPAAVSLVLAVIRVALYLLLSLITASSLGIDVSGVVALASVLTLALSLSLQDALSNLIGGFTLLYTDPFEIGHFVDIGGQSGTVDQIGLTYTKLLTADKKTVSIPNSTVVSSQIVNYTAAGIRRVEISIGVSYRNDPDQVMAALKKAAEVPTALPEPGVYTAISDYGESTVKYILHVWSTADNYWATLHGINRNIQSVFAETGVIMTYPHLNVHVDKA